MESKRQLQVGNAVKKTMSSILQQEGSYIYGSQVLVTVTEVRMSPDLGIAKVYVSAFNILDKQSVVILLSENMSRIKQLLGQRMGKQLRKIPYLDFYLDELLDEIEKVDMLFRKIEKDSQKD